MEMIQIVLIGVISAMLYLVLKDIYPSFAFMITIITSILILFLVIKQIGVIIQLLKTLADRAMVQTFYLETILKIIGIAYITELGALYCLSVHNAVNVSFTNEFKLSTTLTTKDKGNLCALD